MEETIDATPLSSSTAPPSSVDVAQVRDLLESAAQRHHHISEQIVEFSDDPGAAQCFPVKDARRCDYPLTPVTARPSTASALRQQQRCASLLSAAATAASIVDSGDCSSTGGAALERDDTSSSSTAPGGVAWHSQLHLHVVHLLQRLRAHPDQLREFLLMNYEDEGEESVRRKLSLTLGESDEESGDDEELFDGSGALSGSSPSRRESVTERLAGREHVVKKRVGKNYAKLRLVFSQLHRMAFVMGETLYQQVHNMVRRSVAQGVINRQANLVRLESIYKLELRRQVTIEKLLETVKMKDAERRKKKRRQKRDEQHVRTQTLRRKTRMLAAQGGSEGKAGGDSSNNTGPNFMTHSSQLWDQHSEMEPIKSAHFFKMHALERVLALEWRSHQLGGGGDSFIVSTSDLLPQRLVSEQTEELIHEKLTAFLYSKNRETFPVWKEPPESAFTREETLRHLKRLLPVLMTMPLFAGLTIDQLIEFVRVTKWRVCDQGQKVIEKGALMDELVVVMDGKLDFMPQLAKKEPKSADGDTVSSEASDPIVSIDGELPEPGQSKAPPASYFGELGMLSKTEVWKSTLFAKTPSVKMLMLSRVAFDIVLQKLFGGSKSRQLLLVAQQQQRPSSSPAVSARAHVNMSALSPTRPYTAVGAVAREKNVTAFKEMQAAYLQQYLGEERNQICPQIEQQQRQEPETGARTTAITDDEPVVISKAEENKQDEKKQDTSVKPSSKNPAQPPKPKQYPGSTIQHYPSFETPVRGDGTSDLSGIAHTFRLKWAQPIAFQMESLDDSIFSEWAPSFPDTSAMVDFLSSSSLSSTCLLFEKKNVLLKENLRSVCFHHQFLDGAYSNSSQSEQSRNAAPGGDSTTTATEKSTSHPHGTSHLSHGATFTGGSHHGLNHTGAHAQHPENGAENGPITLAQFSDARKKFNSNGSRRQLHGSSSMHNVLNSSSSTNNSATVLSLGHLPFLRSSFVSESSFYADRKGRNGNSSHLSPNHEADEEDERENSGDELDLDEIAALQAQRGGPQRKKSKAKQPQSDDVQSGATGDDDEPDGRTTRARKMALDSLMLSLSGNTLRKSKLLNQDTAKEIIVKKYLKASSAAAEASSAPSHPHKSPRKNVTSGLPFVTSAQLGSEVNSNAPLPLRVDLQRRMEAVLVALKMKPKAKLDLVLKYTHADHYDRFQMAVVLWEQALHYVTKRETALANLWKFELVASDPRRHFRSLSTHRLTEQKERDLLFYQLNFTSDVCREALAELEKQCGDKVWFEDRLYTDKMKKDYTELLFDVEQERLRMIYSDVRPSVSSDDTRSEQSGIVVSENGPRTLARLSTSVQKTETSEGETPSKRWKRLNSVVISTPPPSQSNTNNNNNEDEQAPSQALTVAGSATMSDGIRHRLANPQESIYVCITEKREQEERELALERQRETELQSTHEERERRRRSSHEATHRMAMQVKLQRQAELNELTQRLQTEKQQQIAANSASLAFSRTSKAKRDAHDTSTDEIRRATATNRVKQKEAVISPDLALLQRALHHFIHRPKD